MQKIRIDYSKCTGCRSCEVACSLHHVPDTVSPQHARIRAFREGDLCFPEVAGPYTDAECNARTVAVIDGHEYDTCAICRASCPVKPTFREPDTEIPLKCDFCGVPPSPSCVKWCPSGAITLVDV